MKVTIESIQYTIGWHYPKQGIYPKFSKETNPNKTICIIRNDKLEEDVANGTAVRYFKDGQDKNVARKISLKRALNGKFHKDARKIIWDAYHKMTDGINKTNGYKILEDVNLALQQIGNIKGLENIYFTNKSTVVVKDKMLISDDGISRGILMKTFLVENENEVNKLFELHINSAQNVDLGINTLIIQIKESNNGIFQANKEFGKLKIRATLI